MKNPYLDYCNMLPLSRWALYNRTEPPTFPQFGADCGLNGNFRREAVKRWAWAIPDENAVQITAKYGPLVEMGAGTGYWAWLLSQVGADIVCFDEKPGHNHWCEAEPFFPVQVGGPEILGDYSDRTLFLCWPPYNEPLVTHCLNHWQGNTIVYVGEGYGGCTGWDHRLDEWEVVAGAEIPVWDGVHDALQVLKKK